MKHHISPSFYETDMPYMVLPDIHFQNINPRYESGLFFQTTLFGIRLKIPLGRNRCFGYNLYMIATIPLSGYNRI